MNLAADLGDFLPRAVTAPANAHELCELPDLAGFISGIVLAERNYHSPKTTKELAKSIGA